MLYHPESNVLYLEKCTVTNAIGHALTQRTKGRQLIKKNIFIPMPGPYILIEFIPNSRAFRLGFKFGS
jgi:hypothetical protein